MEECGASATAAAGVRASGREPCGRRTRRPPAPAGRLMRDPAFRASGGATGPPAGSPPARCGGQLITGLVTLLALACAGVGLVSYLVISHTLLNQLDYQLQGGGRPVHLLHRGKAPRGAAAAQGRPDPELQQDPGLNAGTFGPG